MSEIFLQVQSRIEIRRDMIVLHVLIVRLLIVYVWPVVQTNQYFCRFEHCNQFTKMLRLTEFGYHVVIELQGLLFFIRNY